MSKDKKVRAYSTVVRSLASCFFVSRGGAKPESSARAAASGPEAAMVAAAKHFSSIHKVNLG
ncbi:hypothetical protein NMG60_11009408 [Bertholletia excelsa]